MLGRSGAGFVDELFQPRLQIKPLRYGLLAAGQLQDVFDYPIHSLRVVLNNLCQTPIGADQFLGFVQQLRSMADSAQRIADFMGDPGGQAAEGGQFELLGLLGDLRDVFEKHQRLALFVLAQRDKAWL